MKIVEYGRIVEFEEQKLLLFITRKAANSFVRNIAKTLDGKIQLLYQKKYKKWMVGKNNLKIDEEIINLWEGHKKFFICRNPYLRLVSYFLDKHRYIHNPKEKGRTDFEGIPTRISFEDLVNLLFTNINKGNFEILEGHRRLQVFLNINQIKFDSIIKIENGLREQLAEVFRKNNMPETIIYKLSSTPDTKRGWHRRKKSEGEEISTDINDFEESVPVYKLKNFSGIEDIQYKNFYNKELMDKVYCIYKEDFEYFGYSYDSL